VNLQQSCLAAIQKGLAYYKKCGITGHTKTLTEQHTSCQNKITESAKQSSPGGKANGCDDVAGSGKKKDACGVCGGDGRSCAAAAPGKPPPLPYCEAPYGGFQTAAKISDECCTQAGNGGKPFCTIDNGVIKPGTTWSNMYSADKYSPCNTRSGCHSVVNWDKVYTGTGPSTGKCRIQDVTNPELLINHCAERRRAGVVKQQSSYCTIPQYGRWKDNSAPGGDEQGIPSSRITCNTGYTAAAAGATYNCNGGTISPDPCILKAGSSTGGGGSTDCSKFNAVVTDMVKKCDPSCGGSNISTVCNNNKNSMKKHADFTSCLAGATKILSDVTKACKKKSVNQPNVVTANGKHSAKSGVDCTSVTDAQINMCCKPGSDCGLSAGTGWATLNCPAGGTAGRYQTPCTATELDCKNKTCQQILQCPLTTGNDLDRTKIGARDIGNIGILKGVCNKAGKPPVKQHTNVVTGALTAIGTSQQGKPPACMGPKNGDNKVPVTAKEVQDKCCNTWIDQSPKGHNTLQSVGCTFKNNMMMTSEPAWGNMNKNTYAPCKNDCQVVVEDWAAAVNGKCTIPGFKNPKMLYDKCEFKH